MPRPGRRHSLTIAAAALALLAAPAAAQAATYTVQAGEGACAAPGDLLCGSLADAATAVNAGGGGDSVDVPPGSYSESPTFSKPGTTIAGTAPGVVVLGTITFNGGAGAPSALQSVAVLQSGATPAVSDSAASGLEISDSILVSATGNGVTVSAGDTTILRSQLFAGGSSANALDIDSLGTPLTTTLESTILVGGAAGAGLHAKTNNTSALALGSAGDQTIHAYHVTIAGASTAMSLDGSNAPGTVGSVGGNVTVDTSDSIVQGSIATGTSLAVLPLIPANVMTTSFTRTDQTTPSDALFVNPGNKNFHLRADAPVIDKGGFTPGESETDVDGEPRTDGPATDLGADEFVNKPPTAKIAVVTTVPRDGQPVQFDGSASSDQAGDAIIGYAWDFGDGQSAITATPSVTHTYHGEGPVTARLVTIDRRGAQSAAAAASLTILDGGAPAVVITKPHAKQKIKVITTKHKTVKRHGKKHRVTTRKRTRIKFAGAAKDKSGVLAVYLTVQKVSNAKKKTVAKGHAVTTATHCTWLDPKTGLHRRLCDKPILIKAHLSSNGVWTYNVSSKIHLSRGGYKVIAYGVDKAGNAGNAAPKANRDVSFTLK